MAVVLNFTGLVAAFVAFALIFLQADYELSFDKCHPTADRVFRVDKKGDESLFRNILPRGFVDDIIGSSAHIEAGCSFMPFMGETYFSVQENGKAPVGYKKTLICVSEGFIDVFGITMVEGNSRSLEMPGSVIIPRSLAQALFPGEPATGKLLRIDASNLLGSTNEEATVTGVYEDFPSNTQLGNDLYMSVGDFQKGSYGGANFICYLLLDDAGNSQSVADEFNSHFDFASYENWLTPIELVPLTSIYFRNEGNVYKSGSRSQLLLLIAIAILILAIGLINFTNFYVALTPLRIRNINLQKILGSSMVTRGVLMQAFSFGKHWHLLLFVGTVALATGVIAGIWPAIYSTSGQPAMILRGNFGLSESGKGLRAILVGVQLVVSIALMIFVLFVQRQSRYMQEYPCGYDKDNLAVVDIGGENSKVEDVAYSMELIGGADAYCTQSTDFGDGSVMYSLIYCSWNFPEVMGLKLTEGRLFREGDNGPVLLTQGMRAHGAKLEAYEELGDVSPVVGFVEDVNITSLRKADSPVGFLAIDPKKNLTLPYAYIRLSEGADRFATVDKIQSVLKEMDSAMPFEVKFYDSIGKNLYSGEEQLRLSVWLFSLLAVLLSLVGIWGQVLMDVQYKRMEISVKRAFGAEVNQITGEGLRIYLRMLAVCYVIAAPVGWLIVRHYLQQFSHRVGFLPSVFVIALVVVGLLCSAVVLYHYLKMAWTNPAEALKKE